MNARRPGRPAADPARDLRATLLATSRKLLDEAGPGALSMREVARRAGCTHQAPYHYFEDRESILAALVADGFDELARRLVAANDLAPTQGVRAAMAATGRAYVDFALSHPGVFRIMFRPDVCNPQRFPLLQEAGARAYAELERLVRLVHGDEAAPALASVYWAHVHGLACLMIDGPLATKLESAQARKAHVEEVTARFVDIMMKGVGEGRG